MTPRSKRQLREALTQPEWTPRDDSRKIGYARVSTQDQELGMQLDALKRAGVEPSDIFSEHVSGVSKKRPALKDALDQCRRGDVLVVWRLDRIARSLRQLLTILEDLEARGVGFLSLTETVDTTTPTGRLYVQLAGAFAEFERQLTVIRSRAGMKRAKEQGKQIGAKRKIDLAKAEALLREGKSVRDTATACKVAPQTVVNHFPPHARDRLVRLGPLKSKRRT